jgi:hypothetical protein
LAAMLTTFSAKNCCFEIQKVKTAWYNSKCLAESYQKGYGLKIHSIDFSTFIVIYYLKLAQ